MEERHINILDKNIDSCSAEFAEAESTGCWWSSPWCWSPLWSFCVWALSCMCLCVFLAHVGLWCLNLLMKCAFSTPFKKVLRWWHLCEINVSHYVCVSEWASTGSSQCWYWKQPQRTFLILFSIIYYLFSIIIFPNPNFTVSTFYSSHSVYDISNDNNSLFHLLLPSSIPPFLLNWQILLEDLME